MSVNFCFDQFLLEIAHHLTIQYAQEITFKTLDIDIYVWKFCSKVISGNSYRPDLPGWINLILGNVLGMCILIISDR